MTPGGLALAGLAVAIIAQRLAELRLARRHERRARDEGAIEHGARHYPAFFVLHTAWLLGWIVEGWLRGPALAPAWPWWLAAFALAEGLRYWAIVTLGWRWNTRILVVPGRPLVASGPYRLMRHPNYVAVALELLSVPLIFGAWMTATLATIANAALLLCVRIPAESRALRQKP
jgi:methyltransferase